MADADGVTNKSETGSLRNSMFFSCGAYVFLPEEVRANKLAPRSELMTYIGYETGIKGWRFVRPSGAIFTGAMATFDETLFPCCPGAKTPAKNRSRVKLRIRKVHIPHGTPDDGIMPPGPSSEKLVTR